ncbi:MAG: hypothetical protein KC502_16420 [Myxococcales bacterium]|nr:hypothetical protein [Myxococcales bacterium]
MAVIVLVGLPACEAPRHLTAGHRAFERGEFKQAQASYAKSLQSEYLTPDEYDSVMVRQRRFADAAAQRAVSRGPLSPSTSAAQAMARLKRLAEARRRYRSVHPDGPQQDKIDAAMTASAERAWQAVAALQAAKKYAGALHLAHNLVSIGPPPADKWRQRINMLHQRTAAHHSAQRAASSPTQLGLRALHEGLARWGDPKLPNTALAQLDRSLGHTIRVDKASGCGSPKSVARKLSGGSGDTAVTVSLTLSGCKPSAKRTSRMETYEYTHWVTSQVRKPVYRTVYRVTVRRTCRRPIGYGKIELYDCSRKQQAREVSGYRTVTQRKAVKRKGRRRVTVQTYGYRMRAVATVNWKGGSRVLTVPLSETRSEKMSAKSGRAAGHTAAGIQRAAESAAARRLRAAIRHVVNGTLKAHLKTQLAKQATDEAAWLDMQVRLIRLNAGSPRALERRMGLPVGTASAAVSGKRPIWKSTLRVPKPTAPHRRVVDLGDLSSDALDAAFVERGTHFVRWFLGYRRAETVGLPVQGDRTLGAGAYYVSLRLLSTESGFGPMMDIGFASYVGGRTSDAFIYTDGEEEGGLSGGVGVNTALRAGFRANRVSLYGGVRLDYMWHALGDVRAAGWTAPLSVLTVLRFSQRYPINLEVWGYNLFNGNGDYGFELTLCGGNAMSWVFRMEQTRLNGRYGGLHADDIIDIGKATVRSMDLGLQVAF